MLAHGRLKKTKTKNFSSLAADILVSRGVFSRPVPRQPASTLTATSFCTLNCHRVISSLLGHAIAYQWRSSPRTRLYAGPVVLKVVRRVTGAAYSDNVMNQKMCALLFLHSLLLIVVQTVDMCDTDKFIPYIYTSLLLPSLRT